MKLVIKNLAENCWKLLRIDESCWKLLRNAESCWELLKVAESYWKLLIVAENCWKLLRIAESCWKLLRIAESCWKFFRILFLSDFFSLNFVQWFILLLYTTFCWIKNHGRDVECWILDLFCRCTEIKHRVFSM